VGIALLAVANGTMVWAEQWVPSGLAALIVATVPFWMVAFEAALPSGDTLNLRKELK
jgi:drug/metabolite transporter (DMT)-like permease